MNLTALVVLGLKQQKSSWIREEFKDMNYLPPPHFPYDFSTNQKVPNPNYFYFTPRFGPDSILLSQ